MILRMVWKRVEPSGARRVVANLLGDQYTVREHRVAEPMLILQDPSMVEVSGYKEGTLFSLGPRPWRQYCRWHNGPLDRPDRVLDRIYCNLEAEGYCRYHKRSERALYEICLTMKGRIGLEACRQIDRAVRAEYAVYMTDFGGHKPKVGVTRRFRLLERIAEQTHITATLLAVTESAYEARLAETRLSSSGIAQETHKRSLPYSRGLGESAARLAYWAERASKLLGESWSGDIIRIVPPWEGRPRTVKPEALEGHRLVFSSYWGGLIYAMRGDEPVLIPSRPLQHRDVIALGEAGQGREYGSKPGF